jgi:hypothetical protein
MDADGHNRPKAASDAPPVTMSKEERAKTRAAALAEAEAAHQARMVELEAAGAEVAAQLLEGLGGSPAARRVFRREQARLDADRRERAEQERWKIKVRRFEPTPNSLAVAAGAAGVGLRSGLGLFAAHGA